MNIKFMLPGILLSGLLLVACGGGGGGTAAVTGYTGPTTQASISADNQASLAVAATAGASQAIAENAAQDAVFRPAPVTAFVLSFSQQIYTQLTTANRTANQPVDNVCLLGGSLDVTSNQDETQITMIFTNCTVIGGNGEVVNGTVFVTSDPQNINNFSIRFVNVRVQYLGESYTINMTISCNSLGCTWSSDFTGPDGRIYRTENAVVSSFGANTFNINATVYDPDNGSIAISGTVTYGGCAGGVPSSGSLTLTGSSTTSGSVTFNSCESFTVTVDGDPTVYLWADYLP